MTKEEFIEQHCKMCGTQRCEGIGTEWFDGCHYRNELDGYKEEIKQKLDLEEIYRVYNEYLKATKDKPKNYTTTSIGTGDNIADRDYLDKIIKKSNINYNYGWICPRCGKVLAPDVKECSCKSKVKKIKVKAVRHKPSGHCRAKCKYETVATCPEIPSTLFCQGCPYWVVDDKRTLKDMIIKEIAEIPSESLPLS